MKRKLAVLLGIFLLSVSLTAAQNTQHYWSPEDYGIGDSGSDITEWEARANINSYEVQEDSDGEKYLEISAIEGERSSLEFLPSDSSENTETWTRKFTNDGEHDAWAFMRGTSLDDPNNLDTARVDWIPRLDDDRVAEYADGDYNNIASQSITVSEGNTVQMRGSFDGDTLQGKWWADTESEPSQWDLEGATSVTGEGAAGIGHWRGNAFRVYEFGVGTNGDPAPTGLPIVTTGSATDISSDEATLNGELNELNGWTDGDVFFQYRQSGEAEWQETDSIAMTNPDSRSETLTGLQAGTEYEFRTVVSYNDEETGETKTFQTEGGANVESTENLEAPAGAFWIDENLHWANGTTEFNITNPGESLITSVFQSVSQQEEWNDGSFTGTSADGNDNSGDLALGYRNGTESDSLEGYWRLDRTSGAITDYSGQGNDAVDEGVTRGDEGVLSTTSAGFDSSNEEYIEVPYDDSLDITDELTVAFWIKQDWDQDFTGLVGKGDCTFQIRRSGSDDLLLWTLRDDDCNEISDFTVFETIERNEWTHVAATFNSGSETARVYVDGELEREDTDAVGAIGSNTEDIQIGANYDEGSDNYRRFFNGNMDEVKIYSEALTANEVEQLYLDGMDGTFEGRHDRNNIDIPSGQKFSGVTAEATGLEKQIDTTSWNGTNAQLQSDPDDWTFPPPTPNTGLTAEIETTDVDGETVLQYDTNSDEDRHEKAVLDDSEELIGGSDVVEVTALGRQSPDGADVYGYTPDNEEWGIGAVTGDGEGYRAYITGFHGEIRLEQMEDWNNVSELDSYYSTDLDGNAEQWIWTRLRFDSSGSGVEVKARYWLEGESEGTEWEVSEELSNEDNIDAVEFAGFDSSENPERISDLKFMGVGVNGTPAPTEQINEKTSAQVIIDHSDGGPETFDILEGRETYHYSEKVYGGSVDLQYDLESNEATISPVIESFEIETEEPAETGPVGSVWINEETLRWVGRMKSGGQTVWDTVERFAKGERAFIPLIQQISSQSDYNEGAYNATSADRVDNSGNLGLGNRNGTLNDNLVGYWRLDRSSGDVLDYSGNSNHGTISGEVTRGSTGIFGTDAFLMGLDGAVEIPDDDSLENMDEITISVWVNFDTAISDSDEYILNKADSGPNVYRLVREESNNRLTFSGQSFDEQHIDDFERTNWTHIVAQVNETKTNLYIDGELRGDSSSDDGGTINESSFDLYLGAWTDVTGGINGTMDEVQIYERFLSDEEVQQLYKNGRNSVFKGEYSLQEINLMETQSAEKLEVDSSGIDSETSVEFQLHHSSGESETVNLDTGETHRNYSLGFTEEGGSMDIDVEFDSQNVEKTGVVKQFNLWTGEDSEVKKPVGSTWMTPDGDLHYIDQFGEERILTHKETVETFFIIDDFERGNLDPYHGDTGFYQVVNDPSISLEGDYYLEMPDGGEWRTIESSSGLDNYPQQGDYFKIPIQIESKFEGTGVNEFNYVDGNNHYRIWYDFAGSDGVFALDKYEDGTLVESDSFNIDRTNFTDNEWFEAHVDFFHSEDNVVSAKLYETNGDLHGNELSFTDTTPLTEENGFRFSRRFENAAYRWDYVHIDNEDYSLVTAN